MFNCMLVLSPSLHNIFYTPMARYSLYVLKVPLNTNQPEWKREEPLWSKTKMKDPKKIWSPGGAVVCLSRGDVLMGALHGGHQLHIM